VDEEELEMKIQSGILNLLFPPRCAFCRRILKTKESGMCALCEASLERPKNGGAQSGDFFSVCVSPLYYEKTVRESVLRFKFRDATYYANIYGRLLADCIRENLTGQYDIITWVPLSGPRLKKRGYDQAMLLAMSAALKLDDVALELLVKHVDVPAQSGVGSQEKRKANISGAYTAADEELIRGKRVLLIDDIITTGSTISECAKTLRLFGAADVVCATLARSRD
jgi:ComF family protein